MAEQPFGGAELLVLRTADEVAREAATRTVAALAAAIERRGAAHIALTGGSSAVPLYRELSGRMRDALPWERVHLWWGDDRFVPIEHPESNTGMAYRLLLGLPVGVSAAGPSAPAGAAAAGAAAAGAAAAGEAAAVAVPGLPVDPQHVHPIEVEETLSDDDPTGLAAELYAAELGRFVPTAPGGVPRFDVILSGIGPDGHMMSIFPDSPALAADAPFVMGVPAPTHVEPHLPRVTLTARLLPEAGLLIVVATGDAKREMMARVLGGELDPARWPVQRALLPNAVWLLDDAIAADLPQAARSGALGVSEAEAR